MIPIRGSVRSRSPAAVTIGLIVLNCFAYYVESGLASAELESFVTRWGVVPARQTWALHAAPWRIDLWLLPMFTSMFLHGSLAHLLGNMVFLWVFGDGVEGRLGSKRFAAFYALAGMGAAYAQVWMEPDSKLPMVGASGAIAGVLGAYLVLFPRARVTMVLPILFWPLFFELPALTFLGFWFLEQLALGALGLLVPSVGGGVAWWAHAGGFLAGAVLAPILAKPSERGYRRGAEGGRGSRGAARSR